jgi:hypothetical protein
MSASVKYRAGAEPEQGQQQVQQAQKQQIEALQQQKQAQPQQSSNQEDLTQELQNYADLKRKRLGNWMKNFRNSK